MKSHRIKTIKAYLTENPGAIFVLGFMFLIFASSFLILGNKIRFADRIAVYGFYSLIVGVILGVVEIIVGKEKLLRVFHNLYSKSLGGGKEVFRTVTVGIVIVLISYCMSLYFSKMETRYEFFEKHAGDYLILEYPFKSGNGGECDDKSYPGFYREKLLQFHLDERREGIFLKEAVPTIKDIFAPNTVNLLNYIGVKYVVICGDLYQDRESERRLLKNGVELVKTLRDARIYEVRAEPYQLLILIDERFYSSGMDKYSDHCNWMKDEKASLDLYNCSGQRIKATLCLKVISFMRERPLSVFLNGEKLETFTVSACGSEISIKDISLEPGDNELTFLTSKDAERVDNILPDLVERSKASIGIVDLGFSISGVIPFIPQANELYGWFTSYPGEYLVAEYPMDYAYRTFEEKKVFNEVVRKGFPVELRREIEDISSLGLSLKLRYLGVKYVIIHKFLFPDGFEFPFFEDGGFSIAKEFGSSCIYEVRGAPVIFEAEDGFFGVGKRVIDLSASKEFARRAEDDDKEGHLVFGPYVPLLPGGYRVLFRLKVEENAMEQPAALLDICSEQGTKCFVEKEIKYSDFVEKNRYQLFRIDFSVPETLNMEFRVKFLGDGTLWVDYVCLEAVDGVSSPASMGSVDSK